MSEQLGKSLEVPGAPVQEKVDNTVWVRRVYHASDLTRWVHGTLLVHGIVQVRDGEVQLVSRSGFTQMRICLACLALARSRTSALPTTLQISSACGLVAR